MDDFSTQFLYEHAQRGERPAMEELVARLGPRLRAWVAVRLGARLRARLEIDDVVQDILIHVYQGLQEFTPRNDKSFYKWLYKIGEHRIADLSDRHSAQKRDAGREVEFPSRFAGDQTSPSMAAARNEAHEILVAALPDLSEQYRDVIRLRQFEMLENEEVAARLGITPKNASMRYQRACAALAKLIRERSGDSKGL